MASRRLDISSLLCDDSQPQPFSPLDVLVAAATEERKRLDAGPLHPPPAVRVVPEHEHEHEPHVHYESHRRRHSQGDRAEYLDFQRRQQEVDRLNLLRAQELGRRHKEDEERRRRQHHHQHEYDHHLQLQLQQQREYDLKLREQHVKREELQQRDHDRQREHDQRPMAHDIDRREFDRRERQRERAERDHHQREAAERQRDAAEQHHRLNEYQRIEDLRRRQQILLEPHHQPPPLPTASHSPSISHLISHSPNTRRPDHPSSSSSSIHLDPPIIAIPSASYQDPRPIKKRRYSQSPTRPISDDKERIARERDKMSVGELGYGRIDSPAIAPSAPPRRPGSGNGNAIVRKPVAVSDLLAADKERPPPQPPRSQSRDRDPQHVLSPVAGRRSPPGSQSGRAKAARKSDDFLLREPPPQHQIVHLPSESEQPRKQKEDTRTKPDFKTPRLRATSDAVRSPEEPKPKRSSIAKEISLPPPPVPSTSSTKSHPPSSKQQQQRIKKQEDDAHEWFLQHFDEDPSPTISTRHEPPHTPSPSVSPATPNHPAPSAVQPSVKSPPSLLTPMTAGVSLEEELEELVSKPVSGTTIFPSPSTTAMKHQTHDMELDVDLAVTELVDTLDDVKHESPAMEVDVEDELLSLVDDRPPQATATSSSNAAVAARRVAGPSGTIANSAPPPHGSGMATASAALSQQPHSHPSSSVTGKPTSKVDAMKHSPEAACQSSPLPGVVVSPPTFSAASLNVSRQTSTRPTPERGSMPPPASTTVGPRKAAGADRAGSVAPSSSSTATSAAPSGTAAAKKKKESSAPKASSSKSKSASVTPATPASSSSVAPAKPRAKPAAKAKKADPSTASAPNATTSNKSLKPPAAAAGKKGASSTSVSRSRSTSVLPNGARASVGPESDVKADKPDEEADAGEDSDGAPAEDDKLYCICKTKYDEDRFMIACDRCDEWYHTNCLHMSDLEVDLVDQFICPPCVEKNPHLHLRTTYKQRCLYGLRHPDPNSPKACHKAARGAFSKYCSDECGVKYMQSRIDNYAKKGGKPEKLWDSVKNADKREGVVCAVESDGESSTLSADEDVKPKTNGNAKPVSSSSCPSMDVDAAAAAKPTANGDHQQQQPDTAPSTASSAAAKAPRKQKHHLPHNIKTHVLPPSKSKVARETERLHGVLDSVIRLREDLKRGMEVVVWRERLLQLATARAELVDECGWDQRLCMDDEDWEEAGAAALDSYEDVQAKAEAAAARDRGANMEVDGAVDEQWWCQESKVCSRHQGWQTVRYKDISKEKEKNEEALSKLTTREREIRKRIEDMLDPQSTDSAIIAPVPTSVKDMAAASRPTLKTSNKAVNGHAKAKTASASTDPSKKGKKRKAPTA